MIIDEAKAALTGLSRAKASSESVEEAEALSNKKDELNKIVSKLGALLRIRHILREGGVPLSPAPDTAQVKKLCSMMLSRFNESPKATTLVDKQRWSNLSEKLREFNYSEETIQKQDWKSYYSNRLFAGVPPEQRQQTILKSLPENKEKLVRYAQLYGRLIEYRNAVPSQTETLQEVQKWSNELSQIRFVEHNDVPVSVREFFNATSIGANLDLLTADVIAWLRANDMLDKFCVRAR